MFGTIAETQKEPAADRETRQALLSLEVVSRVNYQADYPYLLWYGKHIEKRGYCPD